jgi:MFS family permease
MALVQPASAPDPTAARNLWVVRGLYFTFFGALGLLVPFLSVYFESIGLDGTQIGWINTAAPMLGIFSTTIWGYLSDRSGRTRALIVLAVIGVIVSMSGMYFLRMFWGLLILTSLYSFFVNPLPSLVDSTALRILGSRQDRYGTLRVGGTIGFILTSAASGFYLARVGLAGIFPGFLVIIFLFMVVSFWLPSQPMTSRGSMLQGFTEMIRQPAWLIFASSLFLVFLAFSGILVFIGIAIKDMGGTDYQIGFTSTMSAVGELPIMLLGALLLRKSGAARLVGVGMLLQAVRAVLLGSIHDPALAPVVNTLNGLSYGSIWLGAVTYANDLAPANLKATAQGLMVSVINLATVLGGITSGWLYDNTGRVGLFYTLSGVCFLAFGLFTVGTTLQNRGKLPRTEAPR